MADDRQFVGFEHLLGGRISEENVAGGREQHERIAHRADEQSETVAFRAQIALGRRAFAHVAARQHRKIAGAGFRLRGGEFHEPRANAVGAAGQLDHMHAARARVFEQRPRGFAFRFGEQTEEPLPHHLLAALAGPFAEPVIHFHDLALFAV